MLRGGVSMGLLAGILGMAAIPAVSDSAHTKKHQTKKPPWLCSAHASQCGTIHVLVYTSGGKKGEGTEGPYEHNERLSIGTLGDECGVYKAADQSRCFYTKEDPLHVAPGAYEVAVVENTNETLRPRIYDSQTVTVSATQTQEVTLTIRLH